MSFNSTAYFLIWLRNHLNYPFNINFAIILKLMRFLVVVGPSGPNISILLEDENICFLIAIGGYHKSSINFKRDFFADNGLMKLILWKQ